MTATLMPENRPRHPANALATAEVAQPRPGPPVKSTSTAVAPLLYLVNQYPAVTHTFIRREIDALEKLGHRIERVSFRSGKGLVDARDLAERGRTTQLLERPGNLMRDIAWTCAMRPVPFLRAARLMTGFLRRSDRSILHHLASLAEACAVARIMLRLGIRHIHAHFGTNPAEVALFAAEIAAARYSFTVHGYDEYDKPEFLGLARKIRHAAFVVAVSYYGRSQLLRWCDAGDRAKIKLVRCGLPLGPHEVISRSGLPTSSHFVCVARLCREKAQETLIAAVALLAQRGQVVNLRLVGDGESRKDLEAMIAREGLGAQVTLTGWQTGEQVRREIAAARALVVPSFAENLPVVIMEAMALGKPVIATAIAGIPELVIPGETGWIVPASSVEHLAAAMDDCLRTHEDELARLGACGQARVAAQHDVDKEAGKLSALFNS